MTFPTLGDRASENTTTTGTGTLTLAGALSGYRTLTDACGDGNTVHYVITMPRDNSLYEVGEGTISGGTLSRTTVFSSSNSNALVNLPTGTKIVTVVFTDNAFDQLLNDADIGVTVQAHSAILDATTESFTGALKTKLDGIEAGAKGDQAWGEITGTLSNQSDLQAALDTKSNNGHSHAISDIVDLQATLNGKINAGEVDANDIDSGVNPASYMLVSDGSGGASWQSIGSFGGGNVLSDGTVAMTNGLHFNPGSDADIDIVTIDVTGSPTIYWDESADAFHIENGLVVGDSNWEAAGIPVNGVTYNSKLKISDINGGADIAQMILHRHSTTWPSILVGARSNSDDANHLAVDNGDSLFTIYGLGIDADGEDYNIGGFINFVADGAPSSGNLPGRIVFGVNTGGTTVSEALRLSSDLSADFAGIATFASNLSITNGLLTINRNSNGDSIVFNRSDTTNGSIAVQEGAGFDLAIKATDDLLFYTNNTTALTITDSQNAQFHGDIGLSNSIILDTGATGVGSVSQTMEGVQLLANGMNTTSRLTPAIMFGSDDAQITDKGPLAYIAGYAAQTFSGATTAGMGIEFYTNPSSSGHAPALALRMDHGQNVLIPNGSLEVGSNDSNRGIASLRGHGAGQSYGGELRLYASADYDTTEEYWRVFNYQESLRLGRGSNTDFSIDTAGDVVVYNDFTVNGAFTSTGIDDNATGKRVEISDTAMRLGDGSTSGESYRIAMKTISDGWICLSGGTDVTSGANVLCYGDTHATVAGDLQLRSDSNTFMHWDESAGVAKHYVGNGSKNLAFTFEANGTLHAETANYENLVTDDDDIPNKKYVDDAAASGGGTLVLIETWTPTAVAQKDFTWDESLYSHVFFVFDSVSPATDGADLRARAGYGNGATIISGASDYAGGVSYWAITSSGVGTAANEGVAGKVNVHGTASDSAPPVLQGYSSNIGTGGGVNWKNIWAGCNASAGVTNQIDTIRLYWSSGNFDTTGTVYLYGYKDA